MEWLVVLRLMFGADGAQAQEPNWERAARRGLDYLSREVPRWSAENKCYSCHNNGDAARALYTAARLGYAVDARALADTSRWLAEPERWDQNGGRPGFSDKGLARIQFAAALVDALDSGRVRDRQALVKAAERVAAGQDADGSWHVDAAGAVGSPVTYGACLATYQACRTLKRAGTERFGKALERAERWLRNVRLENVLDAAAVVLALEDKSDSAARGQRERALKLISKGQSRQGGWGPYVHSPPEPFDTAVVLLALSRLPEDAGRKGMIRQGLAFLAASQQADGHWQETTRPAGAESYAQRLSTTGWVVLALVLNFEREHR
jgi:hypothetical protein